MKKKSKKWTRFRHKILFGILRFLVRPILWIIYGFRTKKYKLEKGKGYLILSNHQALLDPLFIALTFNKPIYFVATDNLFNQKFKSALLKYCFAPIAKRKATIDSTCLKNCFQVAKEKGTIGLFVEGNRSYADFQFYIDPSIAKLIKKLELPLILYNLKGGFGVNPRWGNKRRKGKFTGEVKKVISVEEIKELSNEQLYDIVCKELKVFDSELNLEYKSIKRAEYLERQFFVCPICNKTQTIYSKDSHVCCSNCGLKVEYTETLNLKCDNENFKFTKLVDWYKYQLDFIKNYEINDDIIFEDNDVEIYYSNVNKPRELITKGKLVLTKNYIKLEDYIINIKDVISASPIGGFKIIVTTNENNYIIKGHERFNPLKYALIFNILDCPIKEKGGDKYYGFDIY